MAVTKKEPRPEDRKVDTSVEFVVEVYRQFKERGFPLDVALALTAIVVGDLRLYDIMKSVDTVVGILENQL